MKPTDMITLAINKSRSNKGTENKPRLNLRRLRYTKHELEYF
jgi:hypothetical protein